jgi:methionine synthase II (cobalamin-independent)
VKNNGGIPGIHCCSNADWPLVINSGVDIISFDAYDYLESVSLYPSEFDAFLGKGGYLAWGIVPTTDAIRDESAESVRRRFDKGIELLSKFVSKDVLLSRILLTPSCGTGSLSINETEKVFRILVELKKALTADYI